MGGFIYDLSRISGKSAEIWVGFLEKTLTHVRHDPAELPSLWA